jgi:hypothetical protein
MNAAVRAAAIPTTTCGTGDAPCRRASSPALAPPKTIRPARPGGSSRFGAFGLLSSTSSPTASKPTRTLATGFPSGRSSRVLERPTAAIPEKERPPVAAPIASDRPTVRASDVPTTAILPDDAGWCERNPPRLADAVVAGSNPFFRSKYLPTRADTAPSPAADSLDALSHMSHLASRDVRRIVSNPYCVVISDCETHQFGQVGHGAVEERQVMKGELERGVWVQAHL